MESKNEIEFKWAVRGAEDFAAFTAALEKLGAKTGPPEKNRLHDIYLDTADRLFGAVKAKCRLRRKNGEWEMTLKSSSPLEDGLACRMEKTRPLGNLSASAARRRCEKELRPTLGRRRLVRLFEVRNRRTIRKVSFPGGTAAELSFDDVILSRNGKKVKMKEIELELLHGSRAGLLQWTDALTRASGLKPSKASKVVTALTRFGLLGEAEPRPVLFSKYDNLGFAARRVLGNYFEAFKRNEAAVRIGMDAGAVHDLRVASRRLRAAMKTFSAALPPLKERIAAELKTLGRLLGAVRDLEVHGEFLDRHKARLPREACARYAELLRRRQAAARSRLLSFLNSPAGERQEKALRYFCLESPFDKKPTVRKGAEKVFARKVKALRDYAGENGGVRESEMHPLRIALKKLRYACECLEPAAPKKLSAAIGRLRELQDVLGDHQDAVTGIAAVTGNTLKIVPRGGAGFKPLLRSLRRALEKSKRESRKRFARLWKPGFPRKLKKELCGAL